MKAVLETNNPVLLSAAVDRLAQEGIASVVFDSAMSAIEGSIGAFPRRLMVAPDSESRARWALAILAREVESGALARSITALDDDEPAR